MLFPPYLIIENLFLYGMYCEMIAGGGILRGICGNRLWRGLERLNVPGGCGL